MPLACWVSYRVKISRFDHHARIFIGADGGGSTTRVLIATDDGSIWGYGCAHGCNPHEIGIAGAISMLQAAVTDAWMDAGINPQPCSGAFFGIAGASTLSPEQRAALTSWLARLPGAQVEVDHDIRIALAGGLSGRPGIAVIAGTGSAGYGRAGDGRTARAGGWGALLDDAGGGYWLGLRALSSVVRAHDGRANATLLTTGILQKLKIADEATILEWLRRPNIGRPEIAALSPVVFEAASLGDSIAQSIIAEGVGELVSIAKAIAERLFPQQPAEVVFTGGLSQVDQYAAAFSATLRASSHLHCVGARYFPLVGALSLAATGAKIIPLPEWLNAAEQKIRDAAPV